MHHRKLGGRGNVAEVGNIPYSLCEFGCMLSWRRLCLGAQPTDREAGKSVKEHVFV